LETACQPESLDLIVTNPPFHTGKATDYELSQRLIREAPRFLKPGGQLWLVANRFLPYPDLLDSAFGSFSRRAETGKFTVYQALREK
jgi:16S rRNA (guanine1207-N2)-methyltransferase